MSVNGFDEDRTYLINVKLSMLQLVRNVNFKPNSIHLSSGIEGTIWHKILN